MIRPRFALTLAVTKLQSKRALLAASIIVSSLMFAVLIAFVIIFTGAEKSAISFVKKAGNDKYLVKTSPNIPYSEIALTNPLSLETIREIRAKEKAYYDNEKTKYRQLGIPYDASSEIPALTPSSFITDESTPEEARVMLNWQSPVIQQINNEKFARYAERAKNTITDLREVGARYGAVGYHTVDTPTRLPGIPSQRLIINEKEDFAAKEPKSEGSTTFGYSINAAYNGSYSFTDQQLLTRYMPNRTGELKGIPVVLTAQEAVRLFGSGVGIGSEPSSANDKKAWLASAQSQLNGYVYSVCYRNGTELSLLDKIQRDYAEIKSNENTKDYVKPSLLYDYPSTPCGDIKVAADTRTPTEKNADKQAEEQQKKLGTYVAPSHRLLQFQIVGLQYAQAQSEPLASIDSYVKNLLSSQEDLTMSARIPSQLYASLPASMKFDDIPSALASRTIQDLSANEVFTPRVLEFQTVDAARSFIRQEGCSPLATQCDKQFFAAPYGSNYLILDEIGKLFARIAAVAFPALLFIAGIIIWLTVSRIMSENRKETAVYRAMGAQRKDIAAIYLSYVCLIAVSIIGLSFLIGIGGAYAVDYFYGPAISNTAITAFGIVSTAPTFRLFSLESPLLIGIAAMIIAVSILASISPLLRHSRRDPIRDMREE